MRVKAGESPQNPGRFTILNIVFLALAGVLLWRFVRTGGMTMLKMMGGAPPDETSVDAIDHGG